MAVEKDRLALLMLVMLLGGSADVAATGTEATLPANEAAPVDRTRERRRAAEAARPASMVELWPHEFARPEWEADTS